MTYLHNK